NFTKPFNDDANAVTPGPDGLANNNHVIKLLICPSAPPAANRPPSQLANQQPTDYMPIIAALGSPNPFLTGPTASPYFNGGLPPNDDTYQGVLALNRPRRVTDVIDGTSNTLLLVESAGLPQTWVKGVALTTSTAAARPLTGWGSAGRTWVPGVRGTDPSV